MSGFGAITARFYAWFNRNPPSNRIVIDVAELGPDDRVLEVGCGPGAALELAASRIGAERVAAVDPSPTFAAMVAKRVPGADVRVAGAEDVPFDDGAFTVIYTIMSMHHWDDRDDGLATLTAKLAPGGRLLLAERLLEKPGHGITPAQIAAVEARLGELGQTGVHTVRRPDRRKTLAVVVSTRPLAS
ncbi:class I SAM-dependent methyltransferase [Jiangella asiatica]|uniref:Class I SAM-dependent methyltransferase n=1 Tax=Jiangella asiatica TaxID=2530372 RepID=A0A4R5DI26_9ACTN|nr:class I SAM-dependent methyltransferase [Jiangella asiatica]TDE10405.1 class I SAM-dependent methyltransferase [Jiangella asiatica]